MSRNVLEDIAKYDMSSDESAAYKMAAIFEHLLKKMFPDYRHCVKIGRGDPRKSLAFSHAWKVIGEHGHELPPQCYKLYVMAQLKVFKAYLDRGAPVLIDVNCLSGNTAWKRWKLYEKIVQQSSQFQTVAEAGIAVNSQDRVVQELKKTKEYFFKKFQKHSKADVIDSLDDRSLLRFVVMGNVSGYYPYLSPIVKSWLAEQKTSISGYFGYGLAVYADGITDAARSYFDEEFAYEF